MSLTSIVEGLSSRTLELANRVAALEDITIESQSGKKKINIPWELSVRGQLVVAISFDYYFFFFLQTQSEYTGKYLKL